MSGIAINTVWRTFVDKWVSKKEHINSSWRRRGASSKLSKVTWEAFAILSSNGYNTGMAAMREQCAKLIESQPHCTSQSYADAIRSIEVKLDDGTIL